MKYFFYTVIVLIVIGAITFGIYYNIHTKELNKNKFIEDLTKTLKSKDLTYRRVLTLADRYSLSNSELIDALNQLISDIFTERDIRLENKLKILEKYLEYCKSDRPFEDFPDEINIHLNRIREILKENSYAIEPLRIQLKILLETKSEELKKARRIRNWSLAFGILGFLVGLSSLIISSIKKAKESKKAS